MCVNVTKCVSIESDEVIERCEYCLQKKGNKKSHTYDNYCGYIK